MNKNRFGSFRQRNLLRSQAQDRGNAHFVFKGYNSIEISDGTTRLQAAVVNEQEKDSAYIYTHLTDSLSIGSVWEAKSLHWLITEEIVIIKDVKWHKYAALLCNTEIAGTWGRFIGPEEKYINISLKEKSIITSEQKPLVVLPTGTLSINDKIIIGGRPWLVTEYDNISTPGLTYYSLQPTTVSKNAAEGHEEQESYIEEKNSTSYESPVIPYNKEIELPTERGFFKFDNAAIQIISRTSTKVIFKIPFGVNEVTIQTKNNGEIITTRYVGE